MGVALADASEILPETAMLRYRNGSPALFSNRFRYELQRRGKGIWLDSDVYLIRPLPHLLPLFGRQDNVLLNSAVLWLQQDCEMLEPLLALFDERHVPSWLPFAARMSAHVRRFVSGRVGLERLPWGATGPLALSALAERFGVLADALPPQLLYPVPWSEAEWIFDPHQRLEHKVTPETLAVHLWNELIRRRKDEEPASGSFFERLHREARGEEP